MIRALSAEELDVQIPALADVLLDVVAGGASVSFMAGLTRAEAEAYWQRIAAEVRDGKLVLVAAASVDGTAQLILDTPPNQPHRAELGKMLVHLGARLRGRGPARLAAE